MGPAVASCLQVFCSLALSLLAPLLWLLALQPLFLAVPSAAAVPLLLVVPSAAAVSAQSWLRRRMLAARSVGLPSPAPPSSLPVLPKSAMESWRFTPGGEASARPCGGVASAGFCGGVASTGFCLSITRGDMFSAAQGGSISDTRTETAME